MTTPPRQSALVDELLAEEVSGLNPKQEALANRVFRGLRDAIQAGDIPAGTPLCSTDLEAGYKVDNRVVAAALRGLARAELTSDGHAVPLAIGPPPPRPQTFGPEARVERIMRQRLADGAYTPGQLLPSYGSLAKEFDVPVSAIGGALNPLFADGYLSHARPLGTVVTRRVDEIPSSEIRAASPRVTRHTLFTALGETKPLGEWAKDKRCVVLYSLLRSRVAEGGWEIERAMTTPQPE